MKRLCLFLAICGVAVVTGPARAGKLEGTLTADRDAARVGDAVKILVTIRGEGSPSAWEIDQPVLSEAKGLSLAEVGQRNEAMRSGDGENFSINFLYSFVAVEPGEAITGDVNVTYREPGAGEDKVLRVAGAEVAIEERPRMRRAIVICAAAIAGIAIVLFIVYRVRRGTTAKGSPAPPPAEARPLSDAPVKALGRVEAAAREKMEGDAGAFGAKAREALLHYLTEEKEEQIEEYARKLGGLCERVKYGRDPDAEAEIDDIVRKSELFLKKKIREQQ